MDRQNKSKRKVVTTNKRKNSPPPYRQPTGIHICEPRPDAIPSRPSVAHIRSSQESHPAPTNVGPIDDCNRAAVQSTNATRLSSHSGSVGLSSVCLRDTPETPTTGQSGASVIQPGTRDEYRRTYIVPEGYGFQPDDRISKVIYKCLKRRCTGPWPYWSKIPHDVQGLMFAEFKKYFWWDDKDASRISYNFKFRTRTKLNGLFCTARKKGKKPKFVTPRNWKEMLHYWDTDEDFKKRSEKGKKARASVKGGSVHTAGAITQIIVRNKMEKELGRPITQDELFIATHMRKKKKPTDEDTWVESRAQETHEKYMKKIEELRSQGVTPSRDQEVELWKECAGDPVRGSVYGLPGKAFKDKSCWLHCASTSSIDTSDRVTPLLEERVAAVTRELAARDERERKMAEENRKTAEENDRRHQQLQAQLDMIFQGRGIIPPCPSDRPRLQPLPDDYSTEEEEELGEEDEIPPSPR